MEKIKFKVIDIAIWVIMVLILLNVITTDKEWVRALSSFFLGFLLAVYLTAKLVKHKARKVFKINTKPEDAKKQTVR